MMMSETRKNRLRSKRSLVLMESQNGKSRRLRNTRNLVLKSLSRRRTPERVARGKTKKMGIVMLMGLIHLLGSICS